jgi:hypothetical protein
LEAQWARNIKDRIVYLLTFHGEFDPKVWTNQSQLELIVKQLKEEMHATKAARVYGLDAKRLRVEARGRKNVRHEGAPGALPQGYGIEALHVAGADEARWLQNQDACNLLARNPRLQNSHFCPIMVEGGPPCPRNRMVVTPVPVVPVIAAAVEGAILGQPTAVQVQVQPQLPPQLPTLGKFAAMAVPPPVPIAGAALPAAPGQVGSANNAVQERAVLAQCFVANAATAGVG